MAIRLRSLRIFTKLLLHILIWNTAKPQSIIKTLPGYPGPLPFKLKTGYIGLGDEEEVQLFYYFIESERDPDMDPLVLWITGGPGCSGFSALVYETGPLNFDRQAYDPSLVLNPYSWTKIANIIYIDSPRGTGFSYATTPEGYDNSDTKVVEQVYVFLQKWLLKHPNFIKNRLYIAGDSYAALWIPMVVWRISEGIEAGDKPQMPLQGFSVGNPKTDSYIDENTQLPFAHRLGLISDDNYKIISDGEDQLQRELRKSRSNNLDCLRALQQFKECTRMISFECILEPCYPKPSSQEELGFAHRSLGDNSMRISLSSEEGRGHSVKENRGEGRWCRGLVQEWKRCNDDIPFEHNVEASTPYYQLLNKKGYQVLVYRLPYSGEHDLLVPFIGTLQWIRQINISLAERLATMVR